MHPAGALGTWTGSTRIVRFLHEHRLLRASWHCCVHDQRLWMLQVAGGGREAGGQLEKLGYAPVPEGLDLIEFGEQITHQVLHNP